MNDNNLVNNNNNKYKATRNLNTEIENPEININSVTGINIKDVDQDDSSNNTVNNYFNENITNNDIQESNNNTFINTNTFTNTNNYTEPISDYNINYGSSEQEKQYKPTLKEKKKQTSFQIPTELKIMVFIVLILLMFIYVIPYIYDFFEKIKLMILS